MLLKFTPQDGLLVSELSLFIKKIRLSKQKFPAGTFISYIKYDHLKSQNDNLFDLFNDQLDYVLAHCFIESEIIKDNINRFLSNLLITLFIKKLSY